ncbi:MAG: hypothetical protein DRP45_08855, partial [Candidatus Zixiibacteriota bacterium]
ISTAQPGGALAKALLEFDPRLQLEFLKEERRELEKHGETKMYEVSAWSLPLAYNIDAYWTTSSFNVNAGVITKVPLSSGVVHNMDARFAYIIDMVGEKTYQMMVRLFQEEVIMYASQRPFTIEGRSFAPGALVIRVRGNKPSMPELLGQLADEIGLDVIGVNTGNSSEGSLLGAGTYRLLQKPKVGIVMGSGIDYTAFGSLWFMLDQELEIPHSLINVAELDDSRLDMYNVLILPASWGPLDRWLGNAGKLIKDWVSAGGTLICTGESSVWASDTTSGFSNARIKRQVVDKLDDYELGVTREKQAESPEVDTIALYYPEKVPDEKKDKEKSGKPGLDDAKQLDEWQRKFSPQGVIMNALLDTEHWMSFGLGESVPVMVYSRHAFLANPPVKAVARLADGNDIRLSGLLWPEARERWANTAWATRESKGEGQIILFATNPHMRAYFFGSRQLIVNALLYGPGMGARFEGPY